MAISSDDAARIAREHGLSLQDAAALADLASDTGHAARLAAEFAGRDQLTREDLDGMSPAEIVQAKADGRLARLLGEGR